MHIGRNLRKHKLENSKFSFETPFHSGHGFFSPQMQHCLLNSITASAANPSHISFADLVSRYDNLALRSSLCRNRLFGLKTQLSVMRQRLHGDRLIMVTQWVRGIACLPCHNTNLVIFSGQLVLHHLHLLQHHQVLLLPEPEGEGRVDC